MYSELAVIALCILCLALGALSGAALAGKPGRRAARAPEPVDLYPVPDTRLRGPENGLKRETVEMCGATWTLMRPVSEYAGEGDAE